jgi:hypothetical protein
MLLKFSWLLSDLEGLLSFGGRADLERILPQKAKSFPLGMSSFQHLIFFFYPLGYMQQAMMDWQNLRQSKGQSVQEYTQEF